MLKAQVTLLLCILIVVLDWVIVYARNLPATIAAVLCVGVIVAAGLAIGIGRRSFIVAIVGMIVLALASWHFTRFVEYSERTSLRNLAEETSVVILGTVCDTKPSTSARQLHVVIDVRDVLHPRARQMRGRALMMMPPSTAVKKNDYIVASGRIRLPHESRFPWDFNQVNYLHRFGAETFFEPEEANNAVIIIPTTPPTASLDAFFQRLRKKISEVHIAALGERNGSLLSSIVIGNRSVSLDSSVSEAFRNLGLSHLVAASGFNLSIVMAATWYILRPVIRRRIPLTIAVSFMLWMYVSIAGISPSIQRAAFMCLAVMFAGMLLRRAYLPGILALALATTLLLDPYALTDVGLQLSYIATAALIATGNFLFSLVSLARARVARFLIEVSAACIIAQASVLPILLFFFWQLGLLALPANTLISPLIPFITMEGFASSTLACADLIYPAVLLDRLAALLLIGVMGIADWLNSYQWAVLPTGPPPMPAIISYYICFLGMVTCKRKCKRLVASSIGLFICVFALFYRAPLPPLTVIRMPDGIVIIDGGRNALVMDDHGKTSRLRSCLAYHAARATYVRDVPNGETAWIEWTTKTEPEPAITVIMRRTHKTISISTKPSKHADINIAPGWTKVRLVRWAYPVIYPMTMDSLVFSIDGNGQIRRL